MLTDDLLNKYRGTSPISVAKYSTTVLQTYPVQDSSRTRSGQNRLKLYTLFRAEGTKTIPYPAARPGIAHIGEYPPPPPPQEHFTPSTRIVVSRKTSCVSRRKLFASRKKSCVSQRKKFVSRKTLVVSPSKTYCVSRRKLVVSRKTSCVSRRKFNVPRRDFFDTSRGLWRAKRFT